MTEFKRKNAVFKYHDKEYILDKKSLYFFSDENPMRRNLVWLVNWNWFDYFIILCIVLNSILLAQIDKQDYFNVGADQSRNIKM